MGAIKARLVVVGVLAAGLLGSATTRAADKEHGIFTLQNPTRSPIHYQMKWGDCGQWQSYTLEPGTSRWHAYPLDCHSKAPKPYVRFDYILNDNDITWKSYNMEFYASCRLEAKAGMQYFFQKLKNGTELDLFQGEPPPSILPPSEDERKAAEEALHKVQDLVKSIVKPLDPPADIPPDIIKILDLK